MTHSGEFLHKDEQKQDDQLEPTYNSSVPIQDVALKTYRKRWTIEKCSGRESGVSVLMVRHDDDDDDICQHRITTEACVYQSRSNGIVLIAICKCSQINDLVKRNEMSVSVKLI